MDVPSPMSLPFQWQAEAAEMYEYSPVTQGIREAVYEELKTADMIKPQAEELARLQERKKLPEDEEQLHSLLMMEGDLIAGELPVPVEWLENLAERELVAYMEPGIWIAAEQREEYEQALLDGNEEAAMHIVRRMLYYRGGQNAEAVRERYFFFPEDWQNISWKSWPENPWWWRTGDLLPCEDLCQGQACINKGHAPGGCDTACVTLCGPDGRKSLSKRTG